MTEIIRDPVSGTGARVTEAGKLKTYSTVETEALHYNETDKAAYIMELPAVVLGSNWVWAVIKNTDDNDLIVARVVLWTVTNKSNDWISAYTRGAFTYSANGTAATPSCANSGGALSASGTFYYNDAVGDLATITAGQSCGSILATTTPSVFEITSKWVIPKNQVWYLKSELANDNTYRGWVEFYFHNEG